MHFCKCHITNIWEYVVNQHRFGGTRMNSYCKLSRQSCHRNYLAAQLFVKISQWLCHALVHIFINVYVIFIIAGPNCKQFIIYILNYTELCI